MRRLGKVLHTFSQGLLLVKLPSSTPPPIGSKVLSRSGEPIGEVRDVIGSLASPYVVVKASRSVDQGELYVEGEGGRQLSRRGGMRVGKRRG